MKIESNSFAKRSVILAIALLTGIACLIALGVFHSAEVQAAQIIKPVQGSPLPGLTAGQLSLFNTGFAQMVTQWDPVKGLGPVMTQQVCTNCHHDPVGGGTSATLRTTFFGALNSDGSFNPLTNEGGFVLQNMSASKFLPGCPVRPEKLPRDATITSQRVPPQLLGGGLLDSIDDVTIEDFATSKGLGIQGSVNMVADWNGVMRPGRYGAKGQMASLVQAVGTAFLHDIGVTNPVVPNEDCPNAAPGNPACDPILVPPSTCLKLSDPNDFKGPAPGGRETIQLMDYVMFLAPNPSNITNTNGQTLFTSVGCALCHNISYPTKASVKIMTDFAGGMSSPVTALSNQTPNLYSDLLIHHLGPTLADCMQLGQANGDQWRTTPLWGLSTRTVYMHDGRTSDLNTAIQLHKSAANISACGVVYAASEANQVIDNFNALSPADQADLISFIDSL